MSNDDSGTMPGTVLLFSGHMIDAPGRKQPRFPADKESIARDAIVDHIDTGGCRSGRSRDLWRGMRRRPDLCRSLPCARHAA